MTAQHSHAGAQWRDYLGQDAMPSLLLVAGSVITVRLLNVSNGRSEVAAALLTADPAALLLALSLEFVALLLPSVAAACLWEFGRALAERGRATMAGQPSPELYPVGPMLIALLGVLLAFRAPSTSPPVAFVLTAVAIVTYVLNDRDDRRKEQRRAAAQPTTRRPGQRAADRNALRRYILLGLPLTALTVVAFNNSMWMAPERVRFRDDRVRVGYVVASDETWTTVMLEDGRRVLPFRTRDVVGRQVCTLPELSPLDWRRKGPALSVTEQDVPLPACLPRDRG